ncbi:hypothetical protein [Amycolatopsis sp. 3B14]|uniref:hypothetical protein n=1 Tax=Amycolatopsis sp. 3B14 TaxID=3243600 RepID=UPI003D980A07
MPELLAAGLDVRVRAVPNRSLSGDAAYLASVVRAVDGPVVLVGHSYGGAVIAVAGVEENVPALWGAVSTSDRTVNPDVERFGYQWAGTTTVEIDSSHLVMLSHPVEVAGAIREAAAARWRPPRW